MEKKEIKNSLRGLLPRGTASKIREALLNKNSIKPLTLSYINRVINPDSDFWNDDVIEEALTIANDYRAKMDALKNKLPIQQSA